MLQYYVVFFCTRASHQHYQQIETGRTPESELAHLWSSIWLPLAQGVSTDANNGAGADAVNKTRADSEC